MAYPVGHNHTHIYTHVCIYKYEVGIMKQFGGGAKLATIL